MLWQEVQEGLDFPRELAESERRSYLYSASLSAGTFVTNGGRSKLYLLLKSCAIDLLANWGRHSSCRTCWAYCWALWKEKHTDLHVKGLQALEVHSDRGHLALRCLT